VELNGLGNFRGGGFRRNCKDGRALNVEALDGFFAAPIAGPETPDAQRLLKRLEPSGSDAHNIPANAGDGISNFDPCGHRRFCHLSPKCKGYLGGSRAGLRFVWQRGVARPLRFEFSFSLILRNRELMPDLCMICFGVLSGCKATVLHCPPLIHLALPMSDGEASTFQLLLRAFLGIKSLQHTVC
jgi:hypothetical protein